MLLAIVRVPWFPNRPLFTCLLCTRAPAEITCGRSSFRASFAGEQRILCLHGADPIFFFCKQRLIRALACGHNERALQAQRAIKNTYSVCGNSPSVDAFAEEEDRSSIKTSRMIQPRQTEGAPTFHRRTDTPEKQVTRKLLFLLHPL